MNTILDIKDINVYYGSIHAIKNVSLHVNEGEIVTLIGANGAGKSTTLNSIAGIVKPSNGDILFQDKSLIKVPAYKTVNEGLSLVPEGRRIFLQMTVEENLQLGAYTKPENMQNGLDHAYTLFPRLLERRKQIAGTLSGGEQQMLAIGRALMCNPKLLMLDEPSMGLAPIIVEQIFEIIKELNNKGTTILLVEQNAAAALEIADRAYVMETGKIVLEGNASDLMQSEQIKKAYLGA